MEECKKINFPAWNNTVGPLHQAQQQMDLVTSEMEYILMATENSDLWDIS